MYLPDLIQGSEQRAHSVIPNTDNDTEVSHLRLAKTLYIYLYNINTPVHKTDSTNTSQVIPLYYLMFYLYINVNVIDFCYWLS